MASDRRRPLIDTTTSEKPAQKPARAAQPAAPASPAQDIRNCRWRPKQRLRRLSAPQKLNGVKSPRRNGAQNPQQRNHPHQHSTKKPAGCRTSQGDSTTHDRNHQGAVATKKANRSKGCGIDCSCGGHTSAGQGRSTRDSATQQKNRGKVIGPQSARRREAATRIATWILCPRRSDRLPAPPRASAGNNDLQRRDDTLRRHPNAVRGSCQSRR